MTLVKFPDSFYRGVSSPKYYEDGILTQEAFLLDPVREDGFCEVSITWVDEESAYDVISSQVSPHSGKIQFYAISEIQYDVFKQHMNSQIVMGNLSIERKPTITNKYHGNLLVKDSLTKQMKTLIKSQLAGLGNQNVWLNEKYQIDDAQG